LTNQKIDGTAYYPQLDGLRGIAILMVLCYHYFKNIILCDLGWSGVDLFFVLSGFLITGRLLPYIDNKKSILKFYWNRFLRIVPLYFSFLIIFFIGWFTLVSKETLAANPFYSRHWWEFFIFIQNWIFIYISTPTTAHLKHLWSVATEEQFYLLFPLFILIIKRRKKLLVASISVMVLVAICRCLYFYVSKNAVAYEAIYFNTFFRADSFAGGIILFLLLEKNNPPLKADKIMNYLMGTIVLLMLIPILNYRSPDKHSAFFSTIGYTFVALIYTYLLFITLLKKNKIINILTTSAFFKIHGENILWYLYFPLSPVSIWLYFLQQNF
jgi:peptidoglycan/LPS O-acetylase OafA/YrhL